MCPTKLCLSGLQEQHHCYDLTTANTNILKPVGAAASGSLFPGSPLLTTQTGMNHNKFFFLLFISEKQAYVLSTVYITENLHNYR